MSEFEEKLEQILNNRQAMDQIMALANSLNSTAAPNDSSASPAASAPESFDPPINPALLTNLFSLFSDSQLDDEKTALLQALRPFVREERYAKLDRAIRIARLSRLIRMALELTRTKEDFHV